MLILDASSVSRNLTLNFSSASSSTEKSKLIESDELLDAYVNKYHEGYFHVRAAELMKIAAGNPHEINIIYRTIHMQLHFAGSFVTADYDMFFGIRV